MKCLTKRCVCARQVIGIDLHKNLHIKAKWSRCLGISCSSFGDIYFRVFCYSSDESRSREWIEGRLASLAVAACHLCYITRVNLILNTSSPRGVDRAEFRGQSWMNRRTARSEQFILEKSSLSFTSSILFLVFYLGTKNWDTELSTKRLGKKKTKILLI